MKYLSIILVVCLICVLFGCFMPDLSNLLPCPAYKIFRGHTGKIQSVIFTPDNLSIVSAGSDKTIRIGDIDNVSRFLNLPETKLEINKVALSHDGQYLISAGGFMRSGEIILWNFKHKKLIQYIGNLKWGGVSSVAFSSEDKYVVSGHETGSLVVWRISDMRPIRVMGTFDTEIFDVITIPNTELCIAGKGDGIIDVWNMKSGKKTNSLKGKLDAIFCFAYFPGKNILASGGCPVIELWDIKKFGKIKSYKTSRSVLELSFHPTGKYLACGLTDGYVKIIDIDSDKSFRFRAHRDHVNSVSFSDDGKYILSGSSDRTVKIWKFDEIKERWKNCQ